MEKTNKLVELKGISVSFDGEKILDDLHLSILTESLSLFSALPAAVKRRLFA